MSVLIVQQRLKAAGFDPGPLDGVWGPRTAAALDAALGRKRARAAGRFEDAVQRVLAHEGGYVNHPSDPGGATNWGITERVARRHGYAWHMRDLPRAKAVEIYRIDYWVPAYGDKLPAAIGFQVFDAAVNHGIGNAARWLQRAAGVADDGRIGPLTLAAVASADQDDLLMRFNAERLAFYAGLSKFTTFGRGWTRRVAGNLRHAAVDN